ncbi:MAG: hypothetical protein V4582_16500 [Pseudomonadota bacterium]
MSKYDSYDIYLEQRQKLVIGVNYLYSDHVVLGVRLWNQGACTLNTITAHPEWLKRMQDIKSNIRQIADIDKIHAKFAAILDAAPTNTFGKQIKKPHELGINGERDKFGFTEPAPWPYFDFSPNMMEYAIHLP